MAEDPGYPLDDVRTRAERQRVDRTLSRHERGWVDRAETLDVEGSASLAIPDRGGFWASVVGLLTSSPPTYAFQKLIGDGNDPRTLVTDSQGVVTDGTTHLPCAYEVNRNPSVPIGAVVWVVPGVGGPTTGFWEFSYPIAGAVTAPVVPSAPLTTLVADATPLAIGTFPIVPLSADNSTRTIFSISDGLSLTDRAGRRVTLFVIPGSPSITLAATTSTGTATDRIVNPTGLSLVLQPGQSVPLRYDSTLQRWVVESPSPLFAGTTTAGRVPVLTGTPGVGLINGPIYVSATRVGLGGPADATNGVQVYGSLGFDIGGTSAWIEDTPTNVFRVRAVYAGNNGASLTLDDSALNLFLQLPTGFKYAIGTAVGVTSTIAGLSVVGGLLTGGTFAVAAADITSGTLAAGRMPAFTGDVTTTAGAVATAIASGAVTYAKLQNVSATARILARKSSGAGSVEEATLSDVLDFIGSAAQGDVLYRGATTWARLGAGTSGQFLQTQGTGANPQWATGSGSTYTADESTLHLATTTFSIKTTYPGQTSISTLGTITAGAWQATVIAEGYGGTGTNTYAKGDLLYSSATNTLAKLAGNITTTRKFLRQTGTGAVSDAPAWDTLVGADLPVMVASGASHAAGSVPDPGSTAGTQRWLREDASWAAPLGLLLGYSKVDTDETTTSATYVDLTTADSVTFTLDRTQTVLAVYQCEAYNSGVGSSRNQILVDGTAQTAGAEGWAGTAAGSLCCKYVGSLAAGSHTIKVQHSASSGTAHFVMRLLTVRIVG